ncbi:MAG: 4-phosphoerythronate dehydrogenase PdxB [Bacteroidaceae bacterium]
MHVIIDDKIPYIKGLIEQFPGKESITVTYLPGGEINADAVREADALIIRTRTHCDASLLTGSSVRFIATATIGFDHIDTEFCKEQGIFWTNCPGCNADSVAQYVESTLYILSEKINTSLSDLTIGIVGAGHVGSRVAKMAHELGLKVMCSDPPRADKEGAADPNGEKLFYSLAELADSCDILSFHTPLIREGKYPTYHLADADFFRSLSKKSILINTSRGEVVDNQALVKALRNGLIEEAIIDVWENEPHPLPELLDLVFLSTPHIAGYSADGKANATRMSLDAFCRFFGIKADYTITPPAPLKDLPNNLSAKEVALFAYDPRRDSEALRNHPEKFEQLRGNYPLRREKKGYH